jgi:hypothetical protein
VVAIDAFLHQTMADAAMPDTGSAAEDFRLTQGGIMRFLSCPLVAIYAVLRWCVGLVCFVPRRYWCGRRF